MITNNKKKIIIILAIIFVSFLIAFIIIMRKNNKTNNQLTTEQSTTEISITTEEASTNTKEEIVIDKYDTHFIYTIIDITGNESQITCMNIDKLNPEQSADKESLINNIIGYSKSCKKSIEKITILDSSNDEQIYVNASYVNDDPEELVILYDKYNTHSFTRCVNKEEYDMIQAGECAG